MSNEIKALQEENKILSDTIDKMAAQIKVFSDKFEAMEQSVNSITVTEKEKPKPIENPGEVKIGDSKYIFRFLSFRIENEKKELVTVLASEAAKDKDLLADLLKNHPSLFEAVKGK